MVYLGNGFHFTFCWIGFLKYLVLPGWRTVKSMALSFSSESSVPLDVGPFKQILSVSDTPSLKKYVTEKSVFVIGNYLSFPNVQILRQRVFTRKPFWSILKNLNVHWHFWIFLLNKCIFMSVVKLTHFSLLVNFLGEKAKLPICFLTPCYKI